MNEHTTSEHTTGDHFNAFEISPVPTPGPDAVAPEPFRGIYGMPAFVRVPSTDLAASTVFWTRGLGFIELFSVPGTLVHLRRWAFQDVLLVAADEIPTEAPALSVNFACVLDQIEPVARACRALLPDSVAGPRDTAWNTRDIEVITPEHTRVVFTAARPFDPASQEAQNLAAIGIRPPGDDDGTRARGRSAR
ncbi:MAG TPA: VOC family protein [Nocardia sp.]|uniref:VOC family protein n=1 Tax=Nocardia TaxID=1817 RepID=UPI002454696C|nr:MULTISPECIES: VOC family protein [Nocardia]HLS79713.1 VOC family protein [Nocardia sp.]